MSLKTLFTCDKCGTVQDMTKEFWSIGVVVKEGSMTTWSLPHPGKDSIMQVCRPCLELLGIYRSPDIKPGHIAPPPPPTLEDLIVEIVRNQVTDMTGAT